MSGRDEQVRLDTTELLSSVYPPTVHIRPRSGVIPLDVRDLWAHRDLFYFFVLRDVKIRYKQTVLGVAWAILQPFITMVVFTLVFHRVGGVDSGEIPYPIFAFTGLLPWLLFQTGLERSSDSMVREAGLVTKVYFPRLIIPLSSVGSSVFDFIVSSLMLVVLMAYYNVAVSSRMLLLPLFVAGTVLGALSVGVWLAALNARYRDIKHVVPFMIRLWMFLSPVAYPLAALTDNVPTALRWVLLANPIAGMLEGFRWCIVGGAFPGVTLLVINSIAILLVLILGAYYFRRLERTAADFI